MLFSVPKRALGVLCVAATFAAASTTHAAPRDDAFQALLKSPADRTLMLRYARLSVQSRDYEAAVSTLERLLDLEPDNQDARMSLARAYFALGADDVARYHLALVQSRGQLTPDEEADLRALSSAAAERTAPFSYSGFLQAGAIHNSNQGGTGLAYGAGLNLRWDLPGPAGNAWTATLRFDGRDMPGGSANDTSRFLARTGPSFKIGQADIGPELRPYLEFQSVDDDDLLDEGETLLAGIAISAPIGAQWAVFGDVAFGKLRRDTIARDADVTRAIIGAELRPTQNSRIALSFRHQEEDARPGGATRDRTGGRLDASMTFRPGDWAKRNWTAGAFYQMDEVTFINGRQDDITSYGVHLKAYVTRETSLTLAIRRIERDSSVNAQDREDTLLSLVAGWEF